MNGLDKEKTPITIGESINNKMRQRLVSLIRHIKSVCVCDELGILYLRNSKYRYFMNTIEKYVLVIQNNYFLKIYIKSRIISSLL